jgi:trehalose/maltose hydrolase-like predicted phosphorylase
VVSQASYRDDSKYSSAPEGLVATRYEGDAFWDCETWQWPTWLAFFPTVRETNAIFSQTLKNLSFAKSRSGQV